MIEQNVNPGVGYRIRKLTPKECFRLMAFSDEAFDKAKAAGVSNSQLYKQAGNSIVVDVLYYIYRNLYKAMPYLFNNLRVSSFFSGIGAFEAALDKLYADINGATNGEESFVMSNVPLTFENTKRDNELALNKNDSKNPIVYDDYNSNIRKDQSTVGALTSTIGHSALRNSYKLIEA